MKKFCNVLAVLTIALLVSMVAATAAFADDIAWNCDPPDHNDHINCTAPGGLSMTIYPDGSRVIYGGDPAGSYTETPPTQPTPEPETPVAPIVDESVLVVVDGALTGVLPEGVQCQNQTGDLNVPLQQGYNAFSCYADGQQQLIEVIVSDVVTADESAYAYNEGQWVQFFSDSGGPAPAWQDRVHCSEFSGRTETTRIRSFAETQAGVQLDVWVLDTGELQLQANYENGSYSVGIVPLTDVCPA
jgi:hypothetical protein